MVDQVCGMSKTFHLANFYVMTFLMKKRILRWWWQWLWRYNRVKNMKVIVKVSVQVNMKLRCDCESDWEDAWPRWLWMWLWKWGCHEKMWSLQLEKFHNHALILIEEDCGTGVGVGEIEGVTNPVPSWAPMQNNWELNNSYILIRRALSDLKPRRWSPSVLIA